MEHCYHVWAGAPSCFLEFLGKLKKQICRTVGPSLAASLEPLDHRRNVASLVFSIGITLVDVIQNWLNWFCFPFLQGRSTHYSDRLHDFSVNNPRCYKDFYVNSFFPRTAKL